MDEGGSNCARPRAWQRPFVVALAACGLLVLVGSGIVSASGNPFAKYPPGKAAILQREQNEIATAQAGKRAPKTSNDAPPASTPQPTPTAGINNSHAAGPFSACALTVSNMWQGPVHGQWEVVYAGVSYTDQAMCTGAHGELAIFNRHDGSTIGWYTAPAGVTNLTITAVTGDTMTLRTNTGATVTFDLSAKKFV